MPEVKKFVFRSPDGILRGPLTEYGGRCPHCSSLNIVGRGGFDECTACGTRIRAQVPGDVCASPNQPAPKKNPFVREAKPTPKMKPTKKGRK